MSDRAPLLRIQGAERAALLIAELNSVALDFTSRTAVGGTDLSYFIIKQLPVLSPDRFRQEDATDRKASGFVIPRVVELTYTAWDLEPFARDCGYNGPPFIWDEERRFMIRCELDAAFFHLYLGTPEEWQEQGSPELLQYFSTPRDAVDYILETFPIVKRKDEAKYGSYRTKDTILEIYDEMAEVMRQTAAALATGQQPTAHYQSRLDPLPGPPMDAEGNFIPIAQWDRANWPSHIHLPREEAVTRPEEVPLEEFAAMAYPATETDKAICAAALAAVEQSPGLSSMDHLDALLLATHPNWCKTFLDQEDQQAFSAVVNSAPSTLFIDEIQSIRWKECRDYLKQLQAISVRHGDKSQAIGLGASSASVKSDLPGGVDEVVGYAIKAMKRIAELRKDLSTVPQDQLRIIQAFEEQHYQLAA